MDCGVYLATCHVRTFHLLRRCAGSFDRSLSFFRRTITWLGFPRRPWTICIFQDIQEHLPAIHSSQGTDPFPNRGDVPIDWNPSWLFGSIHRDRRLVSVRSSWHKELWPTSLGLAPPPTQDTMQSSRSHHQVRKEGTSGSKGKEDPTWEREQGIVMALQPDTRLANANALRKAIALVSVFGGVTVGIGITGSKWDAMGYAVPLCFVLLALGISTNRTLQHTFAFQGQSLSKSLFQSLMAYVMFWTLASNFCHVFV